MKTRMMLMIGATTVGLAVAGATAATAAPSPDGYSAGEWTHQLMAGFHHGDEDWAGMAGQEGFAGGEAAGTGLGDPESCENYDEADLTRDRLRDRTVDADGDGVPDDRIQQRMRDRVDVTD